MRLTLTTLSFSVCSKRCQTHTAHAVLVQSLIFRQLRVHMLLSWRRIEVSHELILFRIFVDRFFFCLCVVQIFLEGVPFLSLLSGYLFCFPLLVVVTIFLLTVDDSEVDDCFAIVLWPQLSVQRLALCCCVVSDTTIFTSDAHRHVWIRRVFTAA